jgi:hypothetical protein
MISLSKGDHLKKLTRTKWSEKDWMNVDFETIIVCGPFGFSLWLNMCHLQHLSDKGVAISSHFPNSLSELMRWLPVHVETVCRQEITQSVGLGCLKSFSVSFDNIVQLYKWWQWCHSHTLYHQALEVKPEVVLEAGVEVYVSQLFCFLINRTTVVPSFYLIVFILFSCAILTCSENKWNTCII